MPLLKRFSRALSAKLTRITLDQFIESHASSGRTLDIGAQNGPYAKWFPNRVAVDIRRGARVDLLSDAHALALADASFDVVLCTEVLEHLQEPQRAIDEMYRVLKPGGTLLLTTRFLFPIHDAPHDYYRFTKYGLRYLLRKFEILDLNEETTTMGTLAVLVQRVGMQTETRTRALSRGLWLVAAQAIRPWSFLVGREFGDSRRTMPVRGIMTSGYHLRCRKSQ
jgi:SAM-dependent methyltransferase